MRQVIRFVKDLDYLIFLSIILWVSLLHNARLSLLHNARALIRVLEGINGKGGLVGLLLLLSQAVIVTEDFFYPSKGEE